VGVAACVRHSPARLAQIDILIVENDTRESRDAVDGITLGLSHGATSLPRIVWTKVDSLQTDASIASVVSSRHASFVVGELPLARIESVLDLVPANRPLWLTATASGDALERWSESEPFILSMSARSFLHG